MKIGGTNGVGGPQNVYPGNGPKPGGKAASVPPAVMADSVEISDAARIRDAVSRVPEIRADKVAAAKEMIARGEMDTPERMDIALDRLIGDVFDLPQAE
ncbi:MAG TPA: flagellar biosynthesis anti-sigma factor FlgM [Phycisphaerae bacterium]|nr:flagellar biosynthesis anti-sigma factor FlgM [Phycisphaerae bacterium]HOI55411.1 flagellar biosynthesis anti-sigma factor FlgM [Phycisphaerae bacterium]